MGEDKITVHHPSFAVFPTWRRTSSVMGFASRTVAPCVALICVLYTVFQSNCKHNGTVISVSRNTKAFLRKWKLHCRDADSFVIEFAPFDKSSVRYATIEYSMINVD